MTGRQHAAKRIGQPGKSAGSPDSRVVDLLFTASAREGIVRIIKQFAGRKLIDGRIVNLLFENFDEISSRVAGKQAVVKEFHENRFAFL